MSAQEGPKSAKTSARKKWINILAAVIVSNIVCGLLCWNQADKNAKERAAAELQAYIEDHSVSRSLTYQRLADSWTHTLVDVYGDVIFFGDSITAGGLWADYYPYLMPVNLGVVGDTIDGLMIRLQQLRMLMSEKCFVMIGVNDLAFENTVEATLQKYENFLEQLAAVRDETGTQMYIQSVLPVREDVTVYALKNQDIRTLNEGIAGLAEKFGMTYIDVHSLVADENGELNENYSFDGLHLTEAGYQVWQEALIPYLDE